MNQVREILHRSVPFFEDAPCYPAELLAQLWKLQLEAEREKEPGKQQQLLKKFILIMDGLKKKENAPERIYLWPDDNMPSTGQYVENTDFKYNHDPDFRPYMYEMLLPQGEVPKGAVVVCAGGDHGNCVLHEGYQVCLDFNQMGYQCFLLLNRTNHCPYTEKECGADAARAIRMIRKNASGYGIRGDQIVFAGFSNGGLTGEACIEYYSGEQTVKEHFPEYIPDDADEYSGAPDVFLCIYGPRWKGVSFDYSRAVYPPVFFAVGRRDSAMENLNAVYPDLLAHGVQVEIHTFAGVPHGQAGVSVAGEILYPNFQLWLPLADAFIQDCI